MCLVEREQACNCPEWTERGYLRHRAPFSARITRFCCGVHCVLSCTVFCTSVVWISIRACLFFRGMPDCELWTESVLDNNCFVVIWDAFSLSENLLCISRSFRRNGLKFGNFVGFYNCRSYKKLCELCSSRAFNSVFSIEFEIFGCQNCVFFYFSLRGDDNLCAKQTEKG